MDNFTIISYPGSKDNSLLSLTEGRSRYMLPFGGRFRVVDFTIRNSFFSGARSTILYNNVDDGLEKYVNLYGPFDDVKFPPIKVITREFSDINVCYNLIMESNTKYYIIYNGDNPSIIDFVDIIKKYKARKKKSVLFKLMIDGTPSMAYKVLVTDQKSLLKIVNEAIKEDRKSPNIFEMIINIMVNSGIAKGSFNALYWPINNVPEYYELNKKIIWDPEIFNLLYNEKIIQTKILAEGQAQIGESGKVKNSFMSDYCSINGIVEDSIIFPGVEIGEGSIVKNSIILPHVKIGSKAKVIRSIIDERTDLKSEEKYYNISSLCTIGTDSELIKNNDFPNFLHSGITLVGKNSKIINEAKVGGGCYISSGLGEEYFSIKKHLYDGSSLIK